MVNIPLMLLLILLELARTRFSRSAAAKVNGVVKRLAIGSGCRHLRNRRGRPRKLSRADRGGAAASGRRPRVRGGMVLLVPGEEGFIQVDGGQRPLISTVPRRATSATVWKTTRALPGARPACSARFWAAACTSCSGGDPAGRRTRRVQPLMPVPFRGRGEGVAATNCPGRRRSRARPGGRPGGWRAPAPGCTPAGICRRISPVPCSVASFKSR